VKLPPVTVVGSLLALAACGGGAQGHASGTQPTVEILEVGSDVSDRSTEPAPAPRRAAKLEVAQSEEAPDPDSELDGTWAPPPPGTGGVGGLDCDRAADCCMKFVQQHGPDPALVSMCASVRQAPVSSCIALLSSFRQLAPQIGVQCN
jgi:hypothetical protein